MQGSGGSRDGPATFHQTTPAMVLVTRGAAARVAFQVPAASGARYEGDDVRVWDRSGEAQVTWSSLTLACQAARTP